VTNAQQIADSGFNVIFSSFYDIAVESGKLVIKPNKCCGITKPYQLLKDISALGIIVIASSGGDGCQGAPPSGFDSLSDQ
jgi:hypothetical protein